MSQTLKITSQRRITDCYHRQAVAVPAKPPLHMETALMGEASDHVLDGAG